MLRRINAHDAELESESDRPGFRGRGSRIGPDLGARQIGAGLYEIEPGQSTWPYHFHYGNEEWLMVVSGRPSVRHPEGEDELAPGDLVAFTGEPAGAHQVINRTDEVARVLMFSTQHSPQVTVYPDSGKVGIRPPGLYFREHDAVDYWDGEPAPE